MILGQFLIEKRANRSFKDFEVRDGALDGPGEEFLGFCLSESADGAVDLDMGAEDQAKENIYATDGEEEPG